MNPYIGHETQLSGVEEHRLVGGKGDGMRLYEATNGKGLELTLSPDRNGDITRLRYKGINMSYFSPCGYVAPAYYDKVGANWLQSFTAGFLTTCGLQAVGTPCIDDGEELPLHGSIANQPCAQSYWEEDDKEMEILYHMNMGYPLLDEDSEVTIPSVEVRARDDHAQEDIANWMHMEKPQGDYQERCYYHKFEGADGKAGIYQPKLNVGLEISFDASKLDGFVEWKMMGVRDYVLGLECGNCYPDGRDVMRKTGMLKFLKPGEAVDYHVDIKLYQK